MIFTNALDLPVRSLSRATICFTILSHFYEIFLNLVLKIRWIFYSIPTFLLHTYLTNSSILTVYMISENIMTLLITIKFFHSTTVVVNESVCKYGFTYKDWLLKSNLRLSYFLLIEKGFIALGESMFYQFPFFVMVLNVYIDSISHKLNQTRIEKYM